MKPFPLSIGRPLVVCSIACALLSGLGCSGAVSDDSLTLDQEVIDPGDNSLSFEPIVAATSGWGPVERDHSNGESAAGDGHAITLNGKVYPRGFGVHSSSAVTFDVGARCAGFIADVGIDDEVGGRGSVVFQVFADGAKLYDSGVLTGASATARVNVSIAGKRELKLVVTDGGDGTGYDHADWAAPILKNCTPAGTVTPAPAPAPLVFSGPLTITHGGTYSGNWESQNPGVSAVTIQTREPVVIENSNLRSRGNLISGTGLRITVRGTRGEALNPNVSGQVAGYFLNVAEVFDVRVENNVSIGGGFVYVNKWVGSSAAGESIKVLRNVVRNIDGRRSNGSGGLIAESQDSGAARHVVIFNAVHRIDLAEIAWNEVINEPGKSMVADNINMYSSSGTPASPILIHDNYIQGGYNNDPANDPTYSGGGIMLGDGTSTVPLDYGYAQVYDNQVVSTSNYGLAIVGGVEQSVFHNRVVSSGLLPDGRRILAQNVGLYVWDINRQKNLVPSTFQNSTMNANNSGWIQVKADGSTNNNSSWMPDDPSSNNIQILTVTAASEAQEHQSFLAKASGAAIHLGS